MTMQEFFTKNSHLKLSIQHLKSREHGCWLIAIYNTTFDCGLDPIFLHRLSDFEVENLNLRFEDIIMSPILTWYDTWN